MKSKIKQFKQKCLKSSFNVFEEKAENGKKERRIKGYASFFDNVDSYGDIVRRGAFKKTLIEKNRGRKVKFLYQHNMTEPIGVPVDIYEDEKGLVFEAVFADTQKANDAYNLVKIGALDGLSIGYRVIKEEHYEDGTNGLIELELGEVSLVTFEANTKAKITEIKSELENSFVIELLKELGHDEKDVLRAVKKVSLGNDEPLAKHSDNQADKKEKSREIDNILHSLENLKKTIK